MKKREVVAVVAKENIVSQLWGVLFVLLVGVSSVALVADHLDKRAATVEDAVCVAAGMGAKGTATIKGNRATLTDPGTGAKMELYGDFTCFKVTQ